MTEYVDRKALRKAIYEADEITFDGLDIIDNFPSADVQPVKHGRWVKTIGENGVTSACRCSECGFEDNRYSLFNYCPSCGAIMDGET